MPEWLQSIAGPDYAAAVLWTIGALILLVVVLVIIRLIRSITFGTFVAGGRNRKTRLAVMDATAVDSHRRLVLVRRDDVEHLILIGGPTDVVVEQNIRIGQTRRPALTGEAAQEAAPRPQRPVEQPRPAEQPRPPQQQQRPPAPAARDQRPPARPQEREPAYAPPQPQRISPQPQPAPPQRTPPARTEQPAATTRDSYLPRDLQGSAPPRDNPGDDIDRALLDELSTSLDNEPQPGGKAAPVSLEDEMNKLLGELSSHKR